MPTTPHMPRDRHLRICAEDTWGVCPATPTWHALPVRAPGYCAGMESEMFAPDGLYGGPAGSILLPEHTLVRGDFSVPALPELTQLLLGMGLTRSEGRLLSYCADHYTPAGGRRHLGLKAAALTLVTDGQDVVFRLRMVGLQEQENTPLAAGDFDYSALSPVGFRLHRCSVTVDSPVITSVEAFRLEVRNEIRSGPNRGGLAAFLLADARTAELELTVADGEAGFTQALRSGVELAFGAEFTHPAGHAFSLSLPVLRPLEVRDRAEPPRPALCTARLAAVADVEGQDVIYSITLNP